MAGKRKKRRGPKWLQRLQRSAIVFAVSTYIWILRLTCRIEVVEGRTNLDAALARGVVIPCIWHQQIMVSSLFVRSLIPLGLKTGFLTSPSRDGEVTTRAAKHHGTYTIRGSSTRTGREALKALVKGVRDGISPTIYPDGPRGPAHVFKPGAVMVARLTGVPIMPVGCAASRYWQAKSWDQNRIPKPFARLTIAVGDLWPVARAERDMDNVAQQVGYKIDELMHMAEAAQSRTS